MASVDNSTSYWLVATTPLSRHYWFHTFKECLSKRRIFPCLQLTLGHRVVYYELFGLLRPNTDHSRDPSASHVTIAPERCERHPNTFEGSQDRATMGILGIRWPVLSGLATVRGNCPPTYSSHPFGAYLEGVERVFVGLWKACHQPVMVPLVCQTSM